MKLPVAKYYPVAFMLPFLLSSLGSDVLSELGEISRWPILLLGCILSVGTEVKSRRGVKYINSHNGVMLFFLASFFVSAVWSIDTLYTLQRAVSMSLLYYVSFIFFWRYADKFSEARLVFYMLLTVFFFLVISLPISMVFGDMFLAGRYTGIFKNPNNVGLLCGLCLPLSMYLRTKNRTRFFLLIVFVLFTSLLFAATRSAMFGAFVSGGIIFLYLTKRKKIGATLFIIGLATSLYLLWGSAWFEETVLRGLTVQTAANRTLFWELAKAYIADRPVLGFGFGSDAIIHDHYGINLRDLRLRGYGVMSGYYGLAVQMGVAFSVLFFMWLWFVAISGIFRKGHVIETIIFSGVVISGLIISIFESAVYSAGGIFGFIFWPCIMLITRRQYYSRRNIKLDSYGRLVPVVSGRQAQMRANYLST